MKAAGDGIVRRVAISLDMDWGYKRHLETYAGCQRYADEAGWQCSINPAADRGLDRNPADPPYGGVIARATKPLAEAARRAGIPLVNVWMNSPVKGLPSVFPDCEEAGVMAAEHLLSRGFRQFGYLGYLQDIDSRLHQAGFRRVIRREGLRCRILRFARPRLADEALDWEEFVANLEAWIDSWETPIGLFVCNDLYCRYLIDVCRAKGLHVSQDVAIVGCSNETEICIAPQPSLTSIDLGYGRVGYQAAALLDRLMAGGRPPAAPELVAPTELVSRQSTDAFAVDDLLVARALRFMAEHSHQRIRVSDVAAAVATTRRTLERRFRISLGRTIGDEITRLRLERAKRRMVETDASFKELAADSGFRDADHFCRVFSRIEGMPPTRYREARQQVFPQRV